MNWDTNGQFQVYTADGTLLASQVVAVIFAPGAPISGQSQNRSPDGSAPICGGNYAVANYLDTATVNSVNFNNADIASGNFIQGASGGNINDQMVFITRQDIWDAVQKRADFQSTDPNINPLIQMTRQVALCLAKYGNNNNPWDNDSLPRPAPLSLSDYTDNTKYDDTTTLYAGRVPYKVNNSQSSSNNAYSNLMTTSTCGAGWTSTVDIWWNNWKDQLFYGIGSAFKPSGSTHQSCGSCESINGSFHIYPAVIFFAGPRLSALSQTRSDKSVVTDYLETPNGTNFPTAFGYENYKKAVSSPTFNDVLYCIDQSLNVAPC
jgi:hypothetical protein